MKDVVIVDGVRTPIGNFGGALKDLTAHAMGAAVVKELMARTRLDPNVIDEVIFGCVVGLFVSWFIARVWPVAEPVQEPQSSAPPQPSPVNPQSKPNCAHVFAAHVPPPQTLGVPPPPQVWGAVQSPQLMVPPQPSPCSPQVAPSWRHVRGVHEGTPQTFGCPPPPHVVEPAQVPQSIEPPQPSPMNPHE